MSEDKNRAGGGLVSRGLLLAALLVPIVAVVSDPVVTGAAGNSAAAAAVGEGPNIVVIMTDDQTAESMRVMGQTRAALGNQGATFANSFVNLPLCCPSRATFLTGLYAHNHDVTTNAFPNGGFYKFNPDYGDRTLAAALQGAGYHTALVGKYLNEYGALEADPAQVPQGWSEWYATLEPNPDAYNYRLNENGSSVSYGSAPTDYKGDVLTAKALDVIVRQTSAPEPLFLWLSYTAPHGGGPDPSPQPPFDCDPGSQPAPRHATAFDTEPLPRPPDFNEADVSDKPPSIRNSPLLDAAEINTLEGRYRCSLESLLSADEGVHDVVAALRASGELDNTLIVFTSDNGFFNGEHRDAEGKGKHYDPSTRVPLLIRGPGVPAGVVSDELVVNADLSPTILDAADVAPPVAPDGLSLLSLFASAAQWQRQQLLLENRTYAAVRNDRYVYVEHTGGEDAGAIELYDIVADPYELENLHGDPAFAGAEAELADRLSALRVCAGATCSPPPDTTRPTLTTITATVPASPANDNHPKVQGSGAESGSTVKLYGDSTCTGTPIGSGPAADFNGAAGITATVPGDAATNLRATATDAAGNTSACSDPAFAYTEDSSAPETRIAKHPKKKLKAKKKAKAKFEFASSELGSSFECKLDGGAFDSCSSPKTYKLKRGEHTFSVLAIDAVGTRDPSPATFKVKVVRKRKR